MECAAKSGGFTAADLPAEAPEVLTVSATGPTGITSFYSNYGLGVVEEAGGARFGFHCVEIADGSRRIEVGDRVTFSLRAGHDGTLEARQGLKIACLEEIALRMGFIDKAGMERIIEDTPKSSYRDYLSMILRDGF